MATVNNTEFLETIEEPFENYNNTEYNNYDADTRSVYNIIFTYIFEILPILNFLMGLCVTVINILLIVAICRFKRLKSKQNTYILFYAIFNLIYIVHPVLLTIILTIFQIDMHWGFHYLIYLTLNELENSILVFNFLFAFALSFHWLVTISKPEFGIKIKAFYNRFILTIFVSGFFVLALQVMACLNILYFAAYFLLCIVCFTTLIFNFTMNIIRCVQKSSTVMDRDYSLTISNIIFYLWLPKIVYTYLHLYLFRFDHFYYLFLTHSMMNLVSICASIFILVVLLKRNKYFRMGFAKMFCRKSVEQYSTDQDNLDESEENGNQTETETNIP